ncbi:hypothetical protein SYNPS1DRAFT_26251 [Syncephalis pseudoplumigaleata]|uniref:Uncharacterized protein n=1 Tax=Syncephalis pseudoplumigaleata TaxID=1712513 RepID=A0A4P9Z6E8_9FUNG|nr:hypothetical protein SYNPS1DRAFT_26251 [Syncephalis pseudoplumigaleata]|eukprot:RKP28165.1 hypothetical protein SYNPS1DRAFT_26251 [Syncephalis pseudoplumigaleata]
MQRFDRENTDEGHLRQQLQQLQLQMRTLEARLQSYSENEEATRRQQQRQRGDQRHHLLNTPLEDSATYRKPQTQAASYAPQTEYRTAHQHPFLGINVYANGQQPANHRDNEDEVEGEWWRSDIADIHWTRQSLTPFDSDGGEDEMLPATAAAAAAAAATGQVHPPYTTMRHGDYEARKEHDASITTDNASTYSYGVERVLVWMEHALDKYYEQQEQQQQQQQQRQQPKHKQYGATATREEHQYAFMDTVLASNGKHRRPHRQAAAAAAAVVASLPDTRIDDAYSTFGTHRSHQARPSQGRERARGLPTVDELLYPPPTPARKPLPHPYEMLAYPAASSSTPLAHATRSYRPQRTYKPARL